MADKQSKVETVTGVTFSEASFSFDKDTGRLSGVKEKTANNTFKPVNPVSTDFTKVIDSDEARNAYNISQYGGTKTSYIEGEFDVPKLDQEQLVQKYNKDLKAFNNASFVATTDNYRSGRNIADNQGYIQDKTYQAGFQSELDDDGYGSGKKTLSVVLAYPLDINPTQDHMKISRYRYLRADTNLSKPGNRLAKRDGAVVRTDQKGDSTLGGQPLGSIFLPMPKVTDVNGVAWGKSELNASGLLAMNAANEADNIFSLQGRTPSTSQVNRAQEIAQREAYKENKAGGGTSGGGVGVAQAAVNQVNTTIASLITGQELDQDTFLARKGGHVLNPNAEMLFQGPSIRDFSFSFTMVARSQKEGAEIRKIIRFLKLGMAPKFRNTAFLANPDVFELQYKNGTGKDDIIKTVNLFSPGGLALTTMAVDYAPDGYWAAYRDSQPVAVKMDLSFTELRPIYESDQAGTPEDSVGY
tara:strand:+ start:330 stop:1736 length:1407 start_codon:yes stop_codon:yes gene_type:complete